MASRLYTVAGTPAISPAVDAGWENSSDLVRHVLSLSGAAVVDDAAGSPGTGVANQDVATHQLIYGPIAAQTITGTFKGYIAAREVNGGTDARSQVTVRVIGPDGSTVRGTLLAMDTGVLSSEFQVHASDFQSRAMPRGGSTALTSVAATAGDYIVIEIGFRNHGTNTSGVRVRLRPGSSNTTDIPENETTDVTTGHRAWFEFSNTITPYDEAPAGLASGTGTAHQPSASVGVNAGLASGTGTAYDATVSLETPPRTVLINSVDYTDKIMYSAFSLTEAASRGEVGTGGFDVLDTTSALDIPALKAVTFEEPAAGQSNKRLFTGFTHDRATGSLHDASLAARMWAVECTDLNILASDYVLDTGADRGSETDYARVTWLLTTAFGSTGSISAGVVPNSNTVTMEATDYRGRKPADVLAECAEAAAKLWFVYDYGAGRKLYYDVASGTSLTSDAQISDAPGDPDGATVWAPQDVRVIKSPDNIYSKIHLTYNEGTVTASDAAIATAYRVKEAAVLDASITDATLAQAKVDAMLDGSAEEITEVEGLSIVVPLANVNDIRQGQRVEIKLTLHGIADYTFFRVIRRTISPLGPDHYLVSLALASDVLASANGSRGRDDIPQNMSNANDDGATAIWDRGGLTITDGAITVTNAGAVVIIDGTSNMFKILATGTVSNTTSTALTVTTTLSALGSSFTESAASIQLFSTSNSSGGLATPSLLFDWTSSGADYVIDNYVARGYTFVDSGEHKIGFIHARKDAVSTTLYQRYYLLVEAAF